MDRKEYTPKTLLDILVRSRERFGKRTAYIYTAAGSQHEVTYSKLYDDVLLLARSLDSKGVSRGERVLLLSDNRYAWMVTDLALAALGAISVPRGRDTTDHELEHIAAHSGSTVLIAETLDLQETHREVLHRLKGVRKTFIIEAEEGQKLPRKTHSYNEILADRSISEADREWFSGLTAQVSTTDTVTIIYTSGTTGLPKGVILTHSNLMHQVRHIPGMTGFNEKDLFLSILPTWHIFERSTEYVALACGSATVYSSVGTFAGDLAKYRPTVMVSVPRVWESLYSRVSDAVREQGRTKERVFAFLLWVIMKTRRSQRRLMGHLPVFKLEPLLSRAARWLWALATVVFLYPPYLLAGVKMAAVRERMGGRLRMAVSGGGTLPLYLEEWLDAIGVRIVNAYGMTECSPGIAGRGIHCPVLGTLGYPFQETEVRMVGEDGVPVPQGEEGEMQVRGPNVTPGYWNDPEENDKAFTEDGWFRTGDLGRYTVNGEVAITGRSKDIIVLASGENVDPTRIESTMNLFPFVKDAVLVGQDQKGLGALIVPDMEGLRDFVAKKFSHLFHEAEDFMQNAQILDKVRKEINHLLSRSRGFKAHEKLHKIHFLDRDFKIGEEVTNTLKKKRKVIEKRYREIIARLFGDEKR